MTYLFGLALPQYYFQSFQFVLLVLDLLHRNQISDNLSISSGICTLLMIFLLLCGMSLRTRLRDFDAHNHPDFVVPLYHRS